jgi:hypothetical protein
VQKYNNSAKYPILSWVKLTENAKKIRKSLAVCENMYNFAAVFQISVN